MPHAHGAALLELVAVMDRLRSPGGCPWDAEQTHASLEQYLVEETYEVLEAIDTADRDALLEELGDLLLQVVFHARIAEESADSPFSIDDVAAGITAKLVRRHPHVFGPDHDADHDADHDVDHDADPGADRPTAAHTERGWDAIKRAEKGRTSALDGVPMAQPALALAAKVIGRVERAGVDVPVPAGSDALGDRLLALVAEARAAGLDPEAELRAAVRRYRDEVRVREAAERAAATAGALRDQ